MSDITLKKAPYKASSAHSPIIFEFDYEAQTIIAAAYNADNLLTIIPPAGWSGTAAAGMRIYIKSGAYKGFHTIKAVLTYGFLLTYTPFTVTTGSFTCALITLPKFTIEIGHYYFPDELPAETIAEFQPVANLEGILRFDISGYLLGIFDVINSLDETVKGGLTYYTNTFNRFKLKRGATVLFDGLVVNSATDQDQFNELFVDTGAPLTEEAVPIIFSCGTTQIMALNDTGVYSLQYTTPEPGPLIFSTDFNNDYKLTK